MFKSIALGKLQELKKLGEQKEIKSLKDAMYFAAKDSVRNGGSPHQTIYVYKDNSKMLIMAGGHVHVSHGHVVNEEGGSFYVDDEELAEQQELSTKLDI